MNKGHENKRQKMPQIGDYVEMKESRGSENQRIWMYEIVVESHLLKKTVWHFWCGGGGGASKKDNFFPEVGIDTCK
jgi:hypothetical protein